MDPQYTLFGFVVIVVLYAAIGVLAAVGAVFVVRENLGLRAEQIFYGLFLVLIAAFYLAFVAYYGNPAAWQVEISAVVVFALIGLFGVRVPAALVVGYPLHGLWDMVHELHARVAWSLFEPGQLTAVPLAYGVFCAAFDVCIAAYAYTRRAEWNAAWTAKPQQETKEPREPREPQEPTLSP